MCDAAMVLEYGLVGAFDTVAMLCGEEVAIIDTSRFETEPENDSNADLDEISSSNDSLTGVTYSELQLWSISLSEQLFFRFSTRSGHRILICTNQNADISTVGANIVAMIACIRIHAIFIPVDMTNPLKLAQIIHDCQPHAAICVAEDDNDPTITMLSTLNLYRCALLRPDGSLVQMDQSYPTIPPDPKPKPVTHDEDALYILYTSGSTGFPKGVVGTTRGLISRLTWQLNEFPWLPGREEVVLQRTPLTFVDSLAEIFSAILSAVPLYSAPYHIWREGGFNAIIPCAARAGVTRVTLLPSQLLQTCSLFRQLGSRPSWPSLRYVTVSGEECSMELVQLFEDIFPQATLLNLFGSTEVAGDVTFYKACGGLEVEVVRNIEHKDLSGIYAGKVPIGRPIGNNYLFVVKWNPDTETMLILPDGEVGELLIVGEHVAIGYYNKKAVQSASFPSSAFISNPFYIPGDVNVLEGYGERRVNIAMKKSVEESDTIELTRNGLRSALNIDDTLLAYHTCFLSGDLCSRHPENGLLYWLGRKDRQVKIRGVRIELEALERATVSAWPGLLLCEVAAITVAAPAVAQQESLMKRDADEGKTFLVIVIELRALGENQGPNAVRVALASSLPSEMMPHFILTVREFPRTDSKKIDRRTLAREVQQMIFSHDQNTNNDSQTVQKNNLISFNESLTSQSIADRIFSIYSSTLPHLSSQSSAIGLPFTDGSALDFFSLGGDSLTAVEALWMLRRASGLNLSQADLKLTVSELAETIAERLSSMTQLLDETGDDADDIGRAKRQRVLPAETVLIIDHSLQQLLNIKDCSQLDNHSVRSNLRSVRSIERRNVLRSLWLSSDNDECKDAAAPFRQGTEAATPKVMDIEIMWSQKLARCVDSSPLLIEYGPNSTGETSSRIFIGSHGGDFVSVNALTGEICWTALLCGGFHHVEGAASAACLGQVVIVGSFYGADVDGPRELADNNQFVEKLGAVWALHAVTGQVIWSVAVDGEVKSSPLIVSFEGGGIDKAPAPGSEHEGEVEYAVVGSYDGFVYILDIQTGLCLDKCQSGGSIFASPVITHDCGRSKDLCVATTSGDVLQVVVKLADDKKRGPSIEILSRYSMNTPIFSTPLYCSTTDSVLCCGVDGSLHCLNSGGNGLWTNNITASSIFSSPALCSGDMDAEVGSSFVVGAHDGIVRKIGCESGAIVWAEDVSATVFGTPFCTSSSEVIVSTTAGKIVVLDCNNGRILAETELNAEIYSSVIVSRNTIFVGCRDDFIYCINKIAR